MDRENGVLPSTESEAITKRTVALAIVAAICALPLVWFSVDADAGETLLKLTSSTTQTKTVQR